MLDHNYTVVSLTYIFITSLSVTQRKDVGDREILETYLNSESKNTSEIDNFPHGTKSLLTSVIKELVQTTEHSQSCDALRRFGQRRTAYMTVVSYDYNIIILTNVLE